MNKISVIKSSISAFFIAILLGSIILVPLKSSAQTQTVNRADLLLQIEKLTKLIQVLQSQLALKVSQPTYQLHQIEAKTVEAGDEFTVAKLSSTPRNIDTYLNKGELEVFSADTKAVPWKTFESIKIYYKGKLVLEKSLKNEKEWIARWYGGTTEKRYGISIFDGNVKIPANISKELEFELELKANARNSVWELKIPQGGITVWDKVNTYRYLGNIHKPVSVVIK